MTRQAQSLKQSKGEHPRTNGYNRNRWIKSWESDIALISTEANARYARYARYARCKQLGGASCEPFHISQCQLRCLWLRTAAIATSGHLRRWSLTILSTLGAAWCSTSTGSNVQCHKEAQEAACCMSDTLGPCRGSNLFKSMVCKLQSRMSNPNECSISTVKLCQTPQCRRPGRGLSTDAAANDRSSALGDICLKQT